MSDYEELDGKTTVALR